MIKILSALSWYKELVKGFSAMKQANKTEKSIHIIACQVFQPALEHLQLEERYPNLYITYLPSNLHMTPLKLKVYLLEEIDAARTRKERIICIYGECFPNISNVCEEFEIIKVPGCHCYEILLGSDQYKQIVDETAGTYFLEQDLVQNFETYCVEPLELYDEDIRKCCFEHYKRILYIRQPSDPDLTLKAKEVADFLGLALEIRDADYCYLEEKVRRSI